MFPTIGNAWIDTCVKTEHRLVVLDYQGKGQSVMTVNRYRISLGWLQKFGEIG